MPLNSEEPSASQWTDDELRASDEHIRENLQQTHVFIQSLGSMCPRAAVVAAMARIDHELELVLRKVIDGGPCTVEDKLFAPDRALGTYSARCELCYRLGLIDEPFIRALRLYGKIRNRYAHSPQDLAFSDSPLKEWLQEIENIVAVNDGASPDGMAFRKQREHPFHRFTIPLALILTMLMRLRFETPRFRPTFTASIVF